MAVLRNAPKGFGRESARRVLSTAVGVVLGLGVGALGAEIAWAPPNETINCAPTGPCEGTQFNDHIHGNSGFDNIDGRGGSDIIEGTREPGYSRQPVRLGR